MIAAAPKRETAFIACHELKSNMHAIAGTTSQAGRIMMPPLCFSNR